MARLLTALALVASAGAFAPAATQTRSASALSAYVPQGLSASEYAAKKAAAAEAAVLFRGDAGYTSGRSPSDAGRHLGSTSYRALSTKAEGR